MSQIFDVAGELILGTRFKKLGEKFLDEVSIVYKNSEVNFEPSWFLVFFSLDKYGKLTMTEIALKLGITQSAISQIVSSLEKKGLVNIESDDDDKRLKFVSFSSKASELLFKIKPIWKIIKKKMREMLDEGENSRYLLEALGELEYSFSKRGLADRVMESLKEDNYRIEEYKSSYLLALKRLTFSWMFDYGVPKLDFVNNLGEILSNNKVYIAFRDRDAVASLIVLKNKGNVIEMLLIDKSDVSNKASFFLAQNFFNNNLNKKDKKTRIYFDKDKFGVKSILEKNGFVYSDTIKFADLSKELDVFEGMI